MFLPDPSVCGQDACLRASTPAVIGQERLVIFRERLVIVQERSVIVQEGTVIVQDALLRADMPR